MTITRQQLVRRALRKLGVEGAGQVANAEDAVPAEEALGPMMADLSRRNVYSWGDPDLIDDEAGEHLATILAQIISEEFGQEADEGKRILAESRLRDLYTDADAGDPIRAEYF